MKEEKDIELIKENQIYALKIKIPKKTIEKEEHFSKEGNIELSFNNSYKKVKYNISFITEVIKMNLMCDAYKLRYEGNSTFILNSSILFKDEIINFKIDSPKDFRLQLISCEDNTCPQPEKIFKEKGFSLKIKSDKNNNKNEYLSCLLKIIICEKILFPNCNKIDYKGF